MKNTKMLVWCTVETYDKKSYDKKSRLSIFDLRTPKLTNFDRKIGFLVQNCIYSQLEIRKFQTLARKNAISYHMSPPYVRGHNLEKKSEKVKDCFHWSINVYVLFLRKLTQNTSQSRSPTQGTTRSPFSST